MLSEAEPIGARTRRVFVGAAVLALAWLMPLPAAAVAIYAPWEYIQLGTSTAGSEVSAELSHATSHIPTFVGDHSLLLDFESGLWDTDLTIYLEPGITVIDFNTYGNDLKLENTNLFIDGAEDSFAIFRIPDEANFLVSNANIVVGDGGIGLNNVLFYSDKPDSNQHFNVSNAYIHGIAFWDLGMADGEIAFSNVQGYTQVVADHINLSDVVLSNYALDSSSAPMPEPTSMLLFGVGSLVVGAALRKRVS